MRSIRVVVALMMSSLLAACGGGGSSSSSDQDFCNYIRTVSELNAEPGQDDVLGAIDEIISRAPNAELKSALQDLRPVIEKMQSMDANDPSAFGDVMSMMFDPKVVAAGAVIEKYSVDVCGFEPSTDTSMDVGSDSTTEPVDSIASSGLDSLDSSNISDAVESVLADLAPGAYVSSSGWTSSGSQILVDVDVTGTDEVDGMPLCTAVVDLIVSAELTEGFSITITLDGNPIAVASSDSECAPVGD